MRQAWVRLKNCLIYMYLQVGVYFVCLICPICAWCCISHVHVNLRTERLRCRNQCGRVSHAAESTQQREAWWDEPEQEVQGSIEVLIISAFQFSVKISRCPLLATHLKINFVYMSLYYPFTTEYKHMVLDIVKYILWHRSYQKNGHQVFLSSIPLS